MVLLISETERKNRLLDMPKKTKEDMNKFLEECYLWSLEPQVWMDIELLNYPRPPKEWLEYENLPLTQKSKIGFEFFSQLPIREYLMAKNRVIAHNYGHFSWLKEMKAFFPEDVEHCILHRQLDEKILEFSNWFSDYDPVKNQIKEVFGAKEA